MRLRRRAGSGSPIRLRLGAFLLPAILIFPLSSCITIETGDDAEIPQTETAIPVESAPAAEDPGAPPAPAPAEPPPPPAAFPAFPPERTNLTHGGAAWAYVMAGSADPSDPNLAEAVRVADDAGYVAGASDCDQGAASALGLPEGQGILTVSVFLNSQADAVQARDAFNARGFGGGAVGEVRTGCLD